MKQKCFVFVLAVASLTACQKETRPAGILSPEEFSKVLVEVYMAEARMNSTALQRDSAMKLFAAYETKMLQQFELSDSVVRKTQQYYVDHSDQLEKIYDSVIDTLSLREKKLRTKPADTADTLRKEKRIRKPENK
jgi:hypothetical protein